MKILHLTTHLNRGGISKYIFSVGSALQKKGHQIFVASSGGEMEEEFKRGGFQVKNFPIRTKSELSPRIYLALPLLLRWIEQEKVDLLHAHTRITQVMAQWVSCLSGTPFLTTAHGFYKRRLGRRLLPAWGKLTVAISESVGMDLKQTFRLPEDRVRVIFNGIDLPDLRKRFLQYEPRGVRREFKISEGTYVLGTIARLVQDKGHEYLIRAVKYLEPEIQNLDLIIVGDGRYRDHLEALVRELRLEKRVHFTGTLSDVSRPLAAIDLFVLPATWREGFGLSIAEAMACGKPVLVTNIWALNTLIQNGVNGILVEPRNVPALADAIRLLLKNTPLREKIARAGQDTAVTRFSLDRMVKELEGIYEEILNP